MSSSLEGGCDENDFNKFISDNLSGKIDKRKKSEYVKTLVTCKNLLSIQINETRNFETKLFKEENWKILLESVGGFELGKNEEISKITLEILHLYSVITPKGN